MVGEDLEREMTPEEVLFRQAGSVTLDDLATAAELLGSWGRTADKIGGHLDRQVCDVIDTAAREGRSRELILALLIVLTGTFEGALGTDSVQRALTLSAMTCREGWGPSLEPGPQTGKGR